MSSSSIPGISISVINLEQRADRRQAATEEMVKLGLGEDSFRFFSAKSEPGNGAMGCSLSHAMTLAQWLFDSVDEHCLVLEDDFSVRAPDAFWHLISDAIKVQAAWDVFLLASNMAIPIENTPIPNVFRIVNGLSTSAYLVSRRYAPKLIQTFFESAELFRVYGNIGTLRDGRLQRRLFSLDSLWRPHQLKDRFWACLPQICFQRASYSDVEKQNVSYGV